MKTNDRVEGGDLHHYKCANCSGLLIESYRGQDECPRCSGRLTEYDEVILV